MFTVNVTGKNQGVYKSLLHLTTNIVAHSNMRTRIVIVLRGLWMSNFELGGKS